MHPAGGHRLTGSVLVFEDELQGATAGRAAASGDARPVAEIIAARTAAPVGYVPSAYVAPAALGATASVRLLPPERDAPSFDAVRVRVDPATLASAIDRQDGVLRQIFFLHSTLLLKSRNGRQLVGWLGVAMLAMGFGGLVNWWPRRGQWRSAFAVTRGAQGFRLHRELHGAAGIWGLAGVYLALPETVRGIVDLVLPSRDVRALAAAPRVTPVTGATRTTSIRRLPWPSPVSRVRSRASSFCRRYRTGPFVSRFCAPERDGGHRR